MQPALLSLVSAFDAFRVSCEHFAEPPSVLPDGCSRTVDYDYTDDALFHAAHSTDSAASAAGKPSVSLGSNRGKSHNTASNSDSMHSDNSCGNVQDIRHNTSGLRDSGDRRSDNSIGDSGRSPLRSRQDHRRSRDMCNGATDANDMTVYTAESL